MAKKYIRAQVSDGSHGGWTDYAFRHRVSVSALVEAFGLVMAEFVDVPPAEQGLKVIALAQEIDAERRRRD